VDVPLSGNTRARRITIDDEREERRAMAFNIVGPGYFDTMGIPLVRGRAFAVGDRLGTRLVAVINEAMARTYWPGTDPIGRRVRQGNTSAPLEVVGIVADSKYRSLGEEPTPILYLPLLQKLEASFLQDLGNMNVHVRTEGDPVAALPVVRKTVDAMDESLSVQTRLLRDDIGWAFVLPRAGATVLSLFGLIGGVLACIGILGVMSYYVAQRRQEIGIRMALGAQRADVVRMVMRYALGLAAAGLGLGVLGAMTFWRLAARSLYGVSPTDPVAVITAAALLLIMMILACVVPARNAARVDPIKALRAQ